MSKYPMLAGIDEARVDAVGGKATILEEVVKRWPGLRLYVMEELIGLIILMHFKNMLKILLVDMQDLLLQTLYSGDILDG